MPTVLVIALLWFLSLPQALGAGDEASIIEELREQELRLSIHPDQLLHELKARLGTLDPVLQPRAWIFARSLIEGDDGDPRFLEHLRQWQAEADRRGDKEGALRLVWRHVEVIWDSADKAEVQALIDEGIQRACGGELPELFCGRAWGQAARYAYKIGDVANGMTQVQKALTLLEKLEGRSQLFYYNVRMTLINLLNRVEKRSKSLEIAEENLQWYTSQGFTFQATTTAGNLANSLLAVEPFDSKRILQLYDLSLSQAQQIKSRELIAYAYYGKGKLLLRIGDFAAAESNFAKGAALYVESRMLDFAALCQISRARVYMEWKQPKEAHAALEEAARLIAPDFEFERMELLKARISLAVLENDYKTAFTVQKDYTKALQAQWEAQEKKNTLKLSSDLNLQIEEQRTKTLREEAQRFRLFIGILSALVLAVLGLLAWAVRQTRKAQSSERKVRMILDHIDEGLLTIGVNKKVDADHSRHLQHILQKEEALGGQDFMDVVFTDSSVSGEQLSMIQEVLDAVLGESRIAWDLNAEHLPREILFGEDESRTLALRWIPIFDKQDHMQRLLVSLLDITEQRALERAYGSQKRRLQALPRTLQEILQIRPDRLQSLLNKTDALTQAIQDSGVAPLRLRDLHTQKGAARTLGLRALSETLHEWESELQAQTGRHVSSRTLQDGVQRVQACVAEYRDMALVLHQNVVASGDGPWLAAALGAHVQSWIRHMDEVGLPIQEIRVIDAVVHWDARALALLPDLFLHAINNSLDHGFVYPHRRQEKIAAPRITVQAQNQAAGIRIEVLDNGVGLNWPKLKALAEARNFQCGPGETLADIVFADGVSTADQVTISSGRGIGLAAVKQRVVEAGGRIGIQDRTDGSGTLLWAELPYLLQQHRSA